MGITVVKELKVCNPAKRHLCVILRNVTVDTGSYFTWIPSNILRDIGVEARKTETIELADGRKGRRRTGIAECIVLGRRDICRVLFAKQNERPLLGADALWALNLEVDTHSNRLLVKDAFLALGYVTV